MTMEDWNVKNIFLVVFTEKCMPKEHKNVQKIAKLFIFCYILEFENVATEVSNL